MAFSSVAPRIPLCYTGAEPKAKSQIYQRQVGNFGVSFKAFFEDETPGLTTVFNKTDCKAIGRSHLRLTHAKAI